MIVLIPFDHVAATAFPFLQRSVQERSNNAGAGNCYNASSKGGTCFWVHIALKRLLF
jgi:hypothetical protein